MDEIKIPRSTINIEDEMRQSYLDYAMSVIISRALPHARDGLKPVHRRVLYGMYDLGNDWNRAYKKSARIVGDVIGKYHPHGDTAVYDALVRLAQDFAQRYRLVGGQGNFRNIDGGNAAGPPHDGEEEEPVVLPAGFPNLLANGSSGIAVGMATSIPPHNAAELIDACLLLLDKPDASTADLVALVPGAAFPTGGGV